MPWSFRQGNFNVWEVKTELLLTLLFIYHTLKPLASLVYSVTETNFELYQLQLLCASQPGSPGWDLNQISQQNCLSPRLLKQLTLGHGASHLPLHIQFRTAAKQTTWKQKVGEVNPPLQTCSDPSHPTIKPKVILDVTDAYFRKPLLSDFFPILEPFYFGLLLISGKAQFPAALGWCTSCCSYTHNIAVALRALP